MQLKKILLTSSCLLLCVSAFATNLGNLSKNPYSSNSTSSPGSQYNSNSVNNPYGGLTPG